MSRQDHTEAKTDQNKADSIWNNLVDEQPKPLDSDVFKVHDRLTTLPSMKTLYLKVLKKRLGLKRDQTIEPLLVETTLTLTDQWLKSYLDICGWSLSSMKDTTTLTVPLTAPQVLAVPLHMYILTHQEFPVSPLGVVHVSNDMVSHHALPLSTPLRFKAWTGETRWKDRGFELDLHTLVLELSENDSDLSSEKIIWSGKTTLFKPSKDKLSSSTKRPKKKDDIIDGSVQALPLSSNLGRRYAPIAGDYNPIHLYGWSAKLFGFKRPIIHGMWTLAHVLATIHQDPKEVETGRLFVRFRRPLNLPSEAQIRHVQENLGTHLQVLDSKAKLAVDAVFTSSLFST